LFACEAFSSDSESEMHQAIVQWTGCYTHEENPMNIEISMAKQAIFDKFEAQIKTAQAKLDTLRAAAEMAKADVEIKAITKLLPKKQMIEQKLEELKKLGGDRWEQAKGDIEARIADFERSVQAIGSKVKAKAS
jgi:multidrug resistance efflux pump